MNKTFPTLLTAAAAALIVVLAPVPARADALDQPLELGAAADHDAWARHRYELSVSDADGLLRDRLAACAQLAPSDRAGCVREARARHEDDQARASDVLHRPR